MEVGKRMWSLLPAEITVSIAEYLGTSDIARLPAVCGGWSWALGHARSGWPPPPPIPRVISVPHENSPWLLLPNEDRGEGEYCEFLRLSESNPKIRISPLPEIAGRICVGGSPDGWIVTMDLWLNLRVLNPLTREEFPLPSISTIYPYSKMTPLYGADEDDGSISLVTFWNPLLSCSFSDFPHGYVQRVILSAAPPHGIVFLIHGSLLQPAYLAIARIGDQAWCPVLDGLKIRDEHIEDVVYNQNDDKFYIVFLQLLVVLDLKNYCWGSLKPPKRRVLGNFRGLTLLSGTKYVVFSCDGDLLVVWRHYKSYSKDDLLLPSEMDPNEDWYDNVVREETIKIKVFKFNPGQNEGDNPSSCWVRVKNLGDQAIFVGFNYSICISTSDKSWIRKNSVYFADDKIHGKQMCQKYYARDAGIYDLQHKKIERFFPKICKNTWPPPVWFMPSHIKLVL